MSSSGRSGLPARAQPPKTDVLVSLDALFPTDHPTAVGRDGLVLTGWAPGVLHRWLRSATGEWIGVATVLIATTDGGTFRADDQLVPSQALRPRDKPGGSTHRRR